MASQQRIVPFQHTVRAELASVLHSKAFLRAPTLSKILRYLCEKQLAGGAGEINEYSIAVEALGRTPDFDPEIDSIVRVQASRLRKRLDDHYRSESSHAVRIRLPEGSYVPEFSVSGEVHPEVAGRGESFRVVAPLTSPAEPVAIVRNPRPARWILAAASLALLIAIGGFAVRQRWLPQKVSSNPATVHNGAVLSPGGVLAGDPEIRILAGGNDRNFVDSSNQLWARDQYFTGGVVLSRPDRRIRRTLDPSLFRNAREGDFRYDIPLRSGVYELHLHFSELVFGDENLEGTGEGNRRFRVTANGATLLGEMDIVNDASGENTADEKVFTGLRPAADGQLHLEFTSLWNRAVLSGIEIVPGLPDRMLPVRILAGSSGAYTDSKGEHWVSDRYFVGGRALRHAKAVSGTAGQELFRTERFGNFNYAIPVTNGTYAVTLYFAETNFGANNFGFSRLPNGDLQSRIFDVLINGETAIRNLDILKESGGAYRALVKTIKGVKPNAQGKLLIGFVPIRDYACVHAIEVTPAR